MKELEEILKQEIITPEELEHHNFGVVTQMHNGHVAYTNKDYTMIIRDACGTDYYNIEAYWINQKD